MTDRPGPPGRQPAPPAPGRNPSRSEGQPGRRDLEGAKAPIQPGQSPRVAAVQAWIDWRQKLHAARGADGTADPALVLLRQWWKTERLSTLTALGDNEADRVLDKIADLDWQTRPFSPEPDATPVT